MRLIDADALKERLKKSSRYFDLKFDIDEAPTIDAVPVVRCKDCVHGEWEGENKMWACVRCADFDEEIDEEIGVYTGFVEYHNGGHFCSYGDRRAVDGETEKAAL